MEAENGDDIAHYLGKNPKEAHRIAQLHPRSQIREIGKLERVTTTPFQAVSIALPMPDGRVLVNDGRARRLVMLDSTLSRETVITDTMGTTPDAYARGSGEVLFRFRGDSALIVNISTQVGGLYATSCRTEFRVRAGEVTSTDGPFTEAKEEVGGFAIIDVRDHALVI